MVINIEDTNDNAPEFIHSDSVFGECDNEMFFFKSLCLHSKQMQIKDCTSSCEFNIDFTSLHYSCGVGKFKQRDLSCKSYCEYEIRTKNWHNISLLM